MGKILGAVLVLTACMGYAGSLTEKQKFHRDVLFSLVRILELLSEEIRYERLTMEEVFGKVNRKYHEPAGQILEKIAEQLAGMECADLETVWEYFFRDRQRELLLTAEEMDIVLDAGKNLGYLDAAAQVAHLRACARQLEQKLDEAQKEMAQKQRVYRTIAVAAGMTVILVLL